MFDRMDVMEALLNGVNYKIGAKKIIAWNEMHQRMPDNFFEEIEKSLDEEDEYISICDWAFDINTIKALLALSSYAKNNGKWIIVNYELGLAIICKSEKALKEAIKKLPKDFILGTDLNIKNIEVEDNCTVFTYFDHIKVKEYDSRPEYIYKLITNTYE